MKILVTGAAGFIGSHLVDHLINNDHQVIGIDDLSGGFKININKKSTFEKIDLRNKNKTISAINKYKPEIIYHLAADATEGRSQFTPISCTQRNYIATLNLLVGAVKAKTKRVVITSSMSVYGNQEPPFHEGLPPKPVDIYGIAKAAMEHATKVFSQVYGIEFTIIRPHNVYGPRQRMDDPYRNVIAIFINRILQEKPPYIYGDGKQKRAFSYITDVTPYIAKAGILRRTNGEIINIGPREEHTINHISNEVLTHFTRGETIHDHLKPIHGPDRPLEVKNAYCTDKKSRKLLGFKPEVSLKEGIKRTVEWAKTLGPQKFKYLKELELETNETPATWKDQLI